MSYMQCLIIQNAFVLVAYVHVEPHLLQVCFDFHHEIGIIRGFLRDICRKIGGQSLAFGRQSQDISRLSETILVT